MDLLVGCPVSRRAWILPRWHQACSAAAAAAGVGLGYVFVADPDDTDTLETIEQIGRTTPTTVVGVADGRRQDRRDWGPDRYRHMVGLRNRLLAEVRTLGPELFLSLDSDILVHPQAIANLIESAGRFDVVGGKTYMTPAGVACPSWGFFARSGGIRRNDGTGVFPVEIVMAIKLLTPAAYPVGYAYHSHGEDLGFSRNCAAAGLKLGVDARAPNKHVMNRAMLDRIDPRCGF